MQEPIVIETRLTYEDYKRYSSFVFLRKRRTTLPTLIVCGIIILWSAVSLWISAIQSGEEDYFMPILVTIFLVFIVAFFFSD